MGKIAFYYIDKDYLNFLKDQEIKARSFTCVPNIEYSSNEKFFYGAVLNINGINYYVPVSSKTKGKQDDILIRNKKDKIIASLRFNFMLPVPNHYLTRVVLGDKFDEKQNIRIKQELAFCNRKRDEIEKAALKTYERITTLSIEGLNSNSCDFKLLENAYIIYCHEHDIPLSEELRKRYSEISDKPQSKLVEQTTHKPATNKPQGFSFSLADLKRNAKRIHEQQNSAPSNEKTKSKDNGSR